MVTTIATYWAKADKNMDMSSWEITTIEQTTGTWVPVPGETPESGQSTWPRSSASTIFSHEYGLEDEGAAVRRPDRVPGCQR